MDKKGADLSTEFYGDKAATVRSGCGGTVWNSGRGDGDADGRRAAGGRGVLPGRGVGAVKGAARRRVYGERSLRFEPKKPVGSDMI